MQESSKQEIFLDDIHSAKVNLIEHKDYLKSNEITLAWQNINVYLPGEEKLNVKNSPLKSPNKQIIKNGSFYKKKFFQ